MRSAAHATVRILAVTIAVIASLCPPREVMQTARAPVGQGGGTCSARVDPGLMLAVLPQDVREAGKPVPVDRAPGPYMTCPGAGDAYAGSGRLSHRIAATRCGFDGLSGLETASLLNLGCLLTV
jgi:hypothetical protein